MVGCYCHKDRIISTYTYKYVIIANKTNIIHSNISVGIVKINSFYYQETSHHTIFMPDRQSGEGRREVDLVR